MNEAISNSVWVTSPEFAGWLTKRGFAWRKLWRPKWVALHGAEIVYMEKEPTVSNYGLKMTKAQLTASTKIDPDDLDGNPLGFSIIFNDGKSPVWYLRASTVREKKDWIMRLTHVMAIIYWLEDFEKVRVLGLGGTGIVYELLHKTNGTRYALKEIEIKNKAQMQVALQEAEMLKEIMENVSHPNIMHIEKVFQVGSKFYLVFPLCTGGELYEHVIRRGKFTERDAAKLIHDLLSATHALHSRDILHLDIKPENILLESLRDDSPIKLTDFGLSKFFGSLDTTETFLPSVSDMDERLREFSEHGVLNTGKLKGTVGYMAPELILCGHTSKATDIFATGVVLYILLCGHPPFHSKSNRDVLEKTARGVYRLEGRNWRDVSDDAKDLVRRMLERDPAKRIAVEDALAHRWLASVGCDDEEEEEGEGEEEEAGDLVGIGKMTEESARASGAPLHVATGGVDLGANLSRQPSGGKKSSSRNLSGLRLLSEHVAERRSEKFLSGLTNLVSFIQGGNNSGSKLIQFVRLANGQLLPLGPLGQESEPGTDSSSMEDRFVFLNPYVRSALSGAIRRCCEDGKITVDQFLSVLKKLGIAAGLPGMFLCRFVDRDGDGFISADDLFTTQALVIQRSEVFLRVVFRVYCESVWYPGRQLNLVHYYQQQTNRASTPKKSQAASGGHRILDECSPSDVIEPPRFITSRHVAEVFGKLGLDPDDGRSVFAVLCETMDRLNAKQRSPSGESDASSDMDAESVSVSVSSASPLERGASRGSVGVGTVGSGGAGAGAGAGGGNGNTDTNNDKDNDDALPQHNLGAGLSERRQAQPLSRSLSTGVGRVGEDPAPSTSPSTSPSPSSSAPSPQSSHSHSHSHSHSPSPAPASSPTPAPRPSMPPPPSASKAQTARMDVSEFVRCAEFDDVLVQAILRRPRSGFLALVNKAKDADRASLGGGGGSSEMGTTVPPSALEEELVNALRSAKEDAASFSAPSAFPIASAVARGTLSVMSGVQGVMNAAGHALDGVRGMSAFGVPDDDDD